MMIMDGNVSHAFSEKGKKASLKKMERLKVGEGDQTMNVWLTRVFVFLSFQLNTRFSYIKQAIVLYQGWKEKPEEDSPIPIRCSLVYSLLCVDSDCSFLSFFVL